MFRRGADGSFEQIRMDLLGEGDLPSLNWGDIIEVTSANPGSSENFSLGQSVLEPATRRAGLIDFAAQPHGHGADRKRKAYAYVAGTTEDLRTAQKRSAVDDPRSADAAARRGTAALCGSSATVRRSKAKGGGVMRVAVSISRSRDTPTPPSPGDGITLEEGDVIEIAPSDEKEFEGPRRSYVTLIAPGLPASWRIPVKPLRGPPAADGGFFAYSEPTLLQLLASHYAPIPPQPLREALGDAQLAVENLEPDQLARAVRIADIPARLIISHPDWAAVKIRRLNELMAARR